MKELADQARKLLDEQRGSWKLLRKNCQAMESLQTHAFDFGRFVVKAQFNPARLASVAAKVDEHSILNRPCFLCDHNRPPEQHGLETGNGYKILCNPFPILPDHLTIVHIDHRPQRILDSVAAMLDITRDLSPHFVVSYNGPQCGASAPDHLHFQAGRKGFLPLDNEYDRIKQPIDEQDDVSTFASHDYLRQFIGLESGDAQSLLSVFNRLSLAIHSLHPGAIEAMMNVLCSWDGKVWRLIIFPRVKHRPSFYFATDHTRMMLSPGAVDISGVIVVPRGEDFDRMTREHVVEMYAQVTVESDLLKQILPIRNRNFRQ